MFKEFAKHKNSVSVNEFEEAYTLVEHKLQYNKEPSMDEVRRWFIYSYELKYKTKMLGGNIHYIYRTFNNLKDKYSMTNLELVREVTMWRERYHKLNYDTYKSTFDLSVLNTEWLIENLKKNVPNNNKKSTFQNSNANINTKSRRI